MEMSYENVRRKDRLNHHGSNNCGRSVSTENGKRFTAALLNYEVTKILNKVLMRKNVMERRREGDRYVAGPCFPSYHSTCRSGGNSLSTFTPARLTPEHQDERTTNRMSFEVEAGRKTENQDIQYRRSELKNGACTKRNSSPCTNEQMTESGPTRDQIMRTEEISSADKPPKTKSLDQESHIKSLQQSDGSRGPELRSRQGNAEGDEFVKSHDFNRIIQEATDGKNTGDLPKFSQINRVMLEKISDPELRESLQKIIMSNETTTFRERGAGDEKGNSVFGAGRDEWKSREERNGLPYNSSWVEIIDKENSVKFRRMHNRRPTTCRMKMVPDKLGYSKCSGVPEIDCSPVRMLSVDREYVVKGLIGQWLKTRSGNEVRYRHDAAGNSEQHERFQEIKLLKVRLSMKTLAAMV